MQTKTKGKLAKSSTRSDGPILRGRAEINPFTVMRNTVVPSTRTCGKPSNYGKEEVVAANLTREVGERRLNENIHVSAFALRR